MRNVKDTKTSEMLTVSINSVLRFFTSFKRSGSVVMELEDSEFEEMVESVEFQKSIL